MGLISFMKRLWMNEEIKSFKNKGDSSVSDKALQNTAGEGYEHTMGPLTSVGLSSFNIFYNTYVNRAFKNEQDKIANYRIIAQMPEISDVIEDIVIESTQEDLDGKILHLDIIDEELRKNENIVKNIEQEFETLFYNKIKITNIIPDLFRTYFIDGRLFYERLINRAKPSEGIVGIKKLPTETMDFEYDPKTLKITRVFQYLKEGAKRPEPHENEKEGVIIFYPEQIGFIDYGVYGKTRYDILGYLDKAKIPYNQLKLLETSVIIYRIVRAPERLVFKIDVGQMPRDKAIKYVEEQKNRMMKKPTYDPQTGVLTNAPEIFSIQDNIFIPVSCLTLDTEVLTLSGTKTLQRLIAEHDGGMENYAIVYDKSNPNCVISSKIKWAGVTRKNAELVRVFFDNKDFVDLTPDHKFVLPNGDEVEAQYLEIGTQLAAHTGIIKVEKVTPLLYREDTGCLEVENENHNFLLSCGVFVRNSEGGRGSDVTTVGGNPAGFAELADINYFQRKLYKALKYPMSRVSAMEQHQESTIMFSNSPAGEISRDETKWATFLMRHQVRFCDELQKLFLLHLEFKGLKKQYELDDSKINILLNPPSFFKEKQTQFIRELCFSNYLALANQPEISKSWAMERYLDLTPEEIKANAEGLKKDIELGFREPPITEDTGGGFPTAKPEPEPKAGAKPKPEEE